MTLNRSLSLLVVGLLLAACAAPGASPTPVTSVAIATPTAGATPTAAATSTSGSLTPAPPATTPPTDQPTQAPPSPVAAVCGPIDDLPLAAGIGPEIHLTLSTDIPAYPPWWGGDPAIQYPNEPAGGSGWETSDPYSMEGFEGATAYAIAARMGFAPDQVQWIQNAVFENAFAPGDKLFDFHMAQVTITDERATAVDFSEPYFDSNQSVIAMATNPITGVTSIADLKGYTLGAGRNTTSLDFIENVIVPTVEHRALRSNADALRALENGQIDAIVIDLSSAIYMRDVQLEDFDTPEKEATIVGQFSTTLQADHVGAVLEKGSALTSCVNLAIEAIRADGTLQAIFDQWIGTGQEIPFLQ